MRYMTPFLNNVATMKRIKNILINGIVFAISAIFCMFLLEFIIRKLFPAYDPSKMVRFSYNDEGILLGKPNSIWHHWMKAGDFNVTVRFNQYGLRDIKDLQNSTPNDWFVVGDSFSVGRQSAF